VASCYYSRSEFMRSIEQLNFQALDALFYGKVVYDDGFWQKALERYNELEKKFQLNKNRLKKMLWDV